MQKITVAQAISMLRSDSANYARLISEPCGDVGFYRPHPNDEQTPHMRDEVYIVASGHGIFKCGDERKPFGPGDVFFIPRAIEHRFEDFSDDFATWVIFFGPSPSQNQPAAG